MLKQRLFYFCLFILMSYFVTAQELRCNISVSSQKIQGTNRELFTNMQRDMYEFLNNKRWSENIFQYDERIECNIQITLDEQIGSDQFRGSMQVRVSRPVYNSSYSTVLLNFRDNDIDYIYREFEPLEYSETGQNSNLVNLLDPEVVALGGGVLIDLQRVHAALGDGGPCMDMQVAEPLNGSFKRHSTILLTLYLLILPDRAGWGAKS